MYFQKRKLSVFYVKLRGRKRKISKFTAVLHDVHFIALFIALVLRKHDLDMRHLGMFCGWFKQHLGMIWGWFKHDLGVIQP